MDSEEIKEIKEMAKTLIPLYRSKGREREAVSLEIDVELDKLLNHMDLDNEFNVDKNLQLTELQYVKYLLTLVNDFIENKMKERGSK